MDYIPLTIEQAQAICNRHYFGKPCLYDGVSCERPECGGGEPKLRLNIETKPKARIRCRYLGTPVKREGVTEIIKTRCRNSKNKTTEQWHAAHQCNAPKHRRHDGKPGQCLPTFRGPFDDDHQPEAYLFKLCYGCKVNPEFQATSNQ